MKSCILHRIVRCAFLLAVASSAAFSQGTDKIVTKGEETFRYHYFQNSTKVSTVWHMPKASQEGYAVAYDQQGKEIYRGVLSRMHMIRSVEFKYHANGAISVAHERWHPDAGIQSGGTTFTFDENGLKTGESEDFDPRNPRKYLSPSRPDSDPRQKLEEGTPPAVSPGRLPDTPCPTSEPNAPKKERAAALYETHVVIVNRTKKPISIRIIDHQQKYIGKDQFLPTEIAAGDSLEGGHYQNANQFGSSHGLLEFELSAKKEKWLKGVSLNTETPDCKLIDAMHRRCTHLIVRANAPHN
ncbi:MAG: hypothetical protein RLZZ519_2073 [Bacteroidota bacterium]|jgi:hypothetical protein